MELYKLTRGNRTTYGGMKWRKGQTNRAKGKWTRLCSEDLLHAYRTPEMAIFFDPIHGRFLNEGYRMCIIEGDMVADDGTKVGCKEQTVIRWLKKEEIPTMTTEQRIEIGIRCAMEVYKEGTWVRWAERWLSGENRSAHAADVAANAYDVNDAARTAARAAVANAASAADHAARAADHAAAYCGVDVNKIILEVMKEGE